MQTFTEPKELAENPDYIKHKQKNLKALCNVTIDAPIIKIINYLNDLPYCFTMQSCYGHFLYEGQENPYNIEPLPLTNTIDKIKYKIAYIAFCVENSNSGKNFFKQITAIQPNNIQFCSAQWFWEKQINSYVIQVEPARFKNQDTAILDYNEALKNRKNPQ